ncbi:adenylate/guanylate cyclase domain-containing protein [Methylobacterium sp. NEAU 140]|uniref:adenylate/guanylate cyclase domain-containing protein n=1 Tax=Methylobacterium sp. NEAU 140 TaxID=3064945 RepID=UPI002736BB9F|nr:adenylate/guanylate cyclase domain-containing protein [Methylobacterium sp. NEAU 140]MDP4025294.1 adenylate/guanylate cyclase domain-containing protein [Methylobacterium sp. NEAU 140]
MADEETGPAETARILIVDDEPFNLDVLEEELEFLGHASIRAENGRVALARLEEEAFDLVLLDVMMPALDGHAVLERMKADARWRHIPVIMISALTEIRTVVRCIESGAEDYLPKPFEPVLLAARIRACLDRKRFHDREMAHLAAIEVERKRADELLHAILPVPAVAELMATGRIEPRLFDDVAVLFIDLVGFTAWCHGRAPEEIVSEIHHLAEAFEVTAARHGLENIKTIGDAFMATANLLQPNADPIWAAVLCARDMAAAARAGAVGWRVRAGVHVGPVVGGIVGRTKFTFDLWGDTVNTAARVAGTAGAGSLHLSEEACRRLGERCLVVSKGEFPLKGKGECAIYGYALDEPLDVAALAPAP